MEMEYANDRNGTNATWRQVIHLDHHHADSISWGGLLYYVLVHYEWLVSDPAGAQKVPISQGASLVAALFVPHAHGGMIFLSTIPRVDKRREIERNGSSDAPVWWEAATRNDGRPASRLCAGDGAIYLFETDGMTIRKYRIQNYTVQDDAGEKKTLFLSW